MNKRTIHRPYRALNGGFTLVELMVAVSIFAIVLTLSMGAILTVLDANRKAQSISSVMDNLNASVESMTRTIKTNVNYVIGEGGNVITVTDDDVPERPEMQYYFEEVEMNGEMRGAIYFRDGRTEYENAIPITAPEVDVDTFFVESLLPIELCSQPKVLINISGSAGVDERTKSRFSIQTVVSQRDLNLTSDCF